MWEPGALLLSAVAVSQAREAAGNNGEWSASGWILLSQSPLGLQIDGLGRKERSQACPRGLAWRQEGQSCQLPWQGSCEGQLFCRKSGNGVWTAYI